MSTTTNATTVATSARRPFGHTRRVYFFLGRVHDGPWHVTLLPPQPPSAWSAPRAARPDTERWRGNAETQPGLCGMAPRAGKGGGHDDCRESECDGWRRWYDTTYYLYAPDEPELGGAGVPPGFGTRFAGTGFCARCVVTLTKLLGEALAATDARTPPPGEEPLP